MLTLNNKQALDFITQVNEAPTTAAGHKRRGEEHIIWAAVFLFCTYLGLAITIHL